MRLLQTFHCEMFVRVMMGIILISGLGRSTDSLKDKPLKPEIRINILQLL